MGKETILIQESKNIILSFDEFVQLNKLKGHLISLCIKGNYELEDFLPTIDSIIKKYQDGTTLNLNQNG